MRTFWLMRNGREVADGVQFPDGTAVIRWRRTANLKATTAIHDDVGSIVAIHGGSDISAQWCDMSPVTEEDTKKDWGLA